MEAPNSAFDWYRATVPASVEMLTQECMKLGRHPVVEQGHGRFNYRSSRTITAGQRGERLATILYGGPNGHPNVEASGERAPALAALLRRLGEHRVTRCDIAADIAQEGAYEELTGIARTIARQCGVQGREIVPDDRRQGRTLYVGSRQSTVFLRIYEKGKKDRGLYGEWPDELLDSWVRCELEVKPQKEMKGRAALLEPGDFWGVSAWTASFAKEALAMAPDPIPFHPRRTASDETAYRHMVGQYRQLMQRRCQMKFGGDREAMARAWLADVFEDHHASDAA